MNLPNQGEEPEDSKAEMPKLLIPEFGIIQHYDEKTPIPTLSKPKKSSWMSSLCNCFRGIELGYTAQKDMPLLEPQSPQNVGKNTLVLDLDETLVHSTFSSLKSDITIEIEIDRQNFKVYVLKRPGVDEFLQKCYDLFEVVFFTASLSTYANPLLNILDSKNKNASRLFRESCSYINNTYIKDLSKLGRDLRHVIIVDNSPVSYSLQPMNAVPIKTWIDDPDDDELNSCWNVLQHLSRVDDIPKVLGEIKKRKWDLTANSLHKLIESEFIPVSRGPFNSPIHANGEKKFQFEDL
ncbi:hypothetical protein SteCoe_29311 [Stentor coeruleus]|uniref:FCP1 homology domain-containing protein n=1 Tax=Stentor coeruleus TaxID=5963 RepID=A0A1R2B6P7_9CILI|nr:hypothetical protein SteCoe_29311 [Stentor coeruleus]